MKIVNKVGNELSQDAQWKKSIIKPPQFLRVDNFADSSIVTKILGETQPLKQWEVTGEFCKRIKIIFDNKGIDIEVAIINPLEAMESIDNVNIYAYAREVSEKLKLVLEKI